MLLLVTKIMQAEVFALAPELPAHAAAEVLVDRGFDTAPILSGSGTLIGMVSLSELSKASTDATVGDVMLKPRVATTGCWSSGRSG